MKHAIEKAMNEVKTLEGLKNPINASKEQFFKVLLIALKNEGIVKEKADLLKAYELFAVFPASPSAMKNDSRWTGEVKTSSGKAVSLDWLNMD
jgi:hypothetical protein